MYASSINPSNKGSASQKCFQLRTCTILVALTILSAFSTDVVSQSSMLPKDIAENWDTLTRGPCSAQVAKGLKNCDEGNYSKDDWQTIYIYDQAGTWLNNANCDSQISAFDDIFEYGGCTIGDKYYKTKQQLRMTVSDFKDHVITLRERYLTSPVIAKNWQYLKRPVCPEDVANGLRRCDTTSNKNDPLHVNVYDTAGNKVQGLSCTAARDAYMDVFDNGGCVSENRFYKATHIGIMTKSDFFNNTKY